MLRRNRSLLALSLAVGLSGSTRAAPAQIGTVKSEQKISETTGGFGGTLGLMDLFGLALSPIGDVDGDGVPDLAVGAPLHDGVQPNEGAVGSSS